MKDAINQVYTFNYDPLGRLLSQTRAGGTMSFEYDNVGNRKKRTDYAGRVTNYFYDNLNRLTKIEYELGGTGNDVDKPKSTYAYDDISRLTSAVNNVGTVAFTYDNRDRLKTETDVFGQVLEFGYDAASNRTQLKLNGSVHTSYAYDDANRLTTLTDEASQNFTFGYDNADRLTSRTMPNGITSTFEYDNMSRLKRLKHQSSAATLFDNQYVYNAASQINQITDLANTRVFGYDLVDRLTSVHTNGMQTESYTFDDVGNRTASHLSATYGYQSGKFNQLTSTATASFQFDSNGNTVQKSEGSNFWRYVWDYENRLVEASTRKEKARYKYDALGRRVERNLRSSKERTRFTHDGLDVVMDDDAESGITKYQNGLGIDDKLKLTNSGNPSYFLGDHLGSTVGFANSAAAVTSSNAYDSFGNATGNLASKYQFTGREFDSFSGLQFSRARFYDPKLGRFTSEDPIGFGGGDVNLYGYVRNSPFAFRDPTGRIPIVIPVVIGVGIIIVSSPSYVNAPGPRDPVYYPDNPLIANAAGGAVCSYVVGRFVGPALGRLFGRGGTQVTSPRGGYAPPEPLPQQNVGGVDIPLPHPNAQGPHTTLGTRIGSDGIPYRQSASFPGNTWPTANGQQVPWGRTDWTNHGTPKLHPYNPHTRTYQYEPVKFLQTKKSLFSPVKCI